MTNPTPTPSPRTRRLDPFRATAIAAALALGAAACSSDDADSAAEADDPTTTTVATDTTAEAMDDIDVMMGAFGPACGAVPTDGEGSFAGMADDTAATAASNNPLLSTLVTAVVEADLVDTLNSEGPFTIFAPVNDAFAAIDADTLGAVLADDTALSTVLTYHVVAGESLTAADLAGGTFTTVQGEEITLGADGTTVNGVDVVCSDVPVANGTVHIIDEVLINDAAADFIGSLDAMDDAMTEDAMLGASGPACGAVPTDGEGSFAGMADDTAATAASNNPLLSTLVTAVVEADLVDTLNSEGPFTIFAPVNDAFAAIPEDQLAAVLADTDLLTSVLTYHVIAGESLDATALIDGGTFATVQGGEITVAAEGDEFTVNGAAATAVCVNVPVANGTVHIIDGVLLP